MSRRRDRRARSLVTWFLVILLVTALGALIWMASR